MSKHPEKFGQGAIEGVAAPEAANNSAATGSFIPLLTFGIPARHHCHHLCRSHDSRGDSRAPPHHREAGDFLGRGGFDVHRQRRSPAVEPSLGGNLGSGPPRSLFYPSSLRGSALHCRSSQHENECFRHLGHDHLRDHRLHPSASWPSSRVRVFWLLSWGRSPKGPFDNPS